MKILENLQGNLGWFLENWKRSKMVLKFSKNLRKSLKCSQIFGKIRKWFKSVFQMFLWFFKNVFKMFGKSSEIVGSVRKSSDIFGKHRKQFQSVFQMFLWFSKIFEKSSEIFRSVRNSSAFPNVIRYLRNGSLELKSFGAGFWEVLKGPQSGPVNCCAQVMTGK